MEKEKIFEYLSEIGVLLFENIDSFLNIYSNNNSKIFNTEQEKLKNALFIYLQETTKNEQHLNSISNNIIEAFYNKQAINRYNALKNLVNILKLKLFSTFNFFISRIIHHIIKNKTNKPLKEIKDKNDLKKTNKKKKKINKVNKYKNNWYKNIYDDCAAQHGFFLNNNNYDNFLDSSDDINFNYNCNYNNRYGEYDLENSNQYNYNFGKKINDFKSSDIPINYYIPKYGFRNIEDQDKFINENNYFSPEESLRDYDFFLSQERHEQKVKNKLLHLENEKELNLKKQCTFNPKTNSQRETESIPKNVIDNKFIKLYNDSFLNKIKLNEKIKNYLNEIKFKPNLEKTENYIVSSTFKERLIKSINMKDKRKNNKKNNNEKNNEIKNSVINWDKIIKENKEMYKNEGHFAQNIEKKKKLLENIGKKIDISNNININNNNIVIKDSSNMQIKDNNINANDEIKEKEIINDSKLKINEEEKKDEDNLKENINDKYKSSIKHLLKNNSLLKAEY